jgi:serine/threonine protein phosphatase PrpC
VSPFPLDSLEISTNPDDLNEDFHTFDEITPILQPKPALIEDSYAFGDANANSESNYDNHQPRRPLHLSIAEPHTSLAAKFSQTQHRQYEEIPMAPLLISEGTDSISTKATENEEETDSMRERKRQQLIEQSLNCAAAFFGINIEVAFHPEVIPAKITTHNQNSKTNTTNNINTITPPALPGSSKDKEPGPSPKQMQKTQSLPIRVNAKQDSWGSFDKTALHRRVSAPTLGDFDEGSTHSRPQDHVDPKDGHLWRAKYCVLEDGILYFYRNAEDAHSPEAQHERKSCHLLPEESFSKGSSGGGGGGAGEYSDLSKSPMPSRGCLIFSSTDGSLSGSNSDMESNFMWEKRVALTCVGAVRSAETEFGTNAFELLAVEDEEDEGHTDKLVLRAVTSGEMNEWLFQFHRSLASYVMNMMDWAGASPSYALGDIHHPSFAHESLNHTIQTSPLRSFNVPAFSPRFVKHMQTPTAASLSHGHGRNKLRRRRRNDFKTSHSFGTGDSVPSTPLSQSPTQLPFPLTVPSNLVTPLKSGDLPLPEPEPEVQRPMQREMEDTSPELSAPQSANPPETERPPAPSTSGKYVPPHLRKGGAKYVPPHLRNKDNVGESASKPPEPRKYVPPHLRNENGSNSSNIKTNKLSPRSLSLDEKERIESACSAPKAAGSRTQQGLPGAVEAPVATAFQLGGCADPRVIPGSILDQRYIPKKASRVGPVHTDPFGSFGGSKNSQPGDHTDLLNNPSSSLQWEVGAVSQCGVRDSNEDAYLVTNDLLEAFSGITADTLVPTYWDSAKNHQTGLFAIFDGHCGNQAARFAAEKLPYFLYGESLQDITSADLDPKTIEEIMRRAIVKMDEEFCRVCVEDTREWESGTTALIAMLANEHLIIANIGDCRGAICRSAHSGRDQRPSVLDGEVWNELVADRESGRTGQRCFWREVAEVHSPSRKDEKARIEEAGGWTTTEKEIPISQFQRMDFWDEDVIGILKRCCFFDRVSIPQGSKACSSAPQRILQITRVCGELAVSRAIGDRDFKAACNRPTSSEDDQGKWDCPLLLPFPEDHCRQFVGDLVSGKPDFHAIRVGEVGVQGEFLLLACDGLWDVMDMDDAVRVTRDLLFEKKWPAKQAVSLH